MKCALIFCLILGLYGVDSDIKVGIITKEIEHTKFTFHTITIPDSHVFKRLPESEENPIPGSRGHVFVPDPNATEKPKILFKDGDNIVPHDIDQMHLRPRDEADEEQCDMMASYISHDPKRYANFNDAIQKNDHVETRLPVIFRTPLSPDTDQQVPPKGLIPQAPAQRQNIAFPPSPWQGPSFLPTPNVPKPTKGDSQQESYPSTSESVSESDSWGDSRPQVSGNTPPQSLTPEEEKPVGIKVTLNGQPMPVDLRNAMLNKLSSSGVLDAILRKVMEVPRSSVLVPEPERVEPTKPTPEAGAQESAKDTPAEKNNFAQTFPPPVPTSSQFASDINPAQNTSIPSANPERKIVIMRNGPANAEFLEMLMKILAKNSLKQEGQ